MAQQLNADSLLLDERKASTIARQMGLKVTGTLGVLALAADKKILDFPTAVASLRTTNFREPKQIVDALLQRFSL